MLEHAKNNGGGGRVGRKGRDESDDEEEADYDDEDEGVGDNDDDVSDDDDSEPEHDRRKGKKSSKGADSKNMRKQLEKDKVMFQKAKNILEKGTSELKKINESSAKKNRGKSGRKGRDEADDDENLDDVPFLNDVDEHINGILQEEKHKYEEVRSQLKTSSGRGGEYVAAGAVEKKDVDISSMSISHHLRTPAGGGNPLTMRPVYSYGGSPASTAGGVDSFSADANDAAWMPRSFYHEYVRTAGARK
jgi:hypothetical protein